MPIGILGFQGRRLRQGRALRRIPTITALADLTGISKQMISRYESDEAKPTEARLELIARALNLPVEFFLKSTVTGADQAPHFRSMVAALRGDRERATELLVLAHEVVHHLEEYVEMPVFALPLANPAGEVFGLTGDDIEQAAISTRKAMGFPSGPLPNLVTLVERHGVIVLQTELAERELDGVSGWYDGRPIVVLNTTKAPARSRFDLAHEVGHIVLHSAVPDHRRSSTSAFKEVERQAHRFAGALLLPGEEFRADLWALNLDEFVAIKAKWQASAQAMLQRAYDLHLISSDDYLRMRKQISARKWREVEPLESVVREERPTVMRQSLEVIRDAVPGGLDVIRRDLPYGNILSELAGMSPQSMDGRERKVIDIREYRRT